MICQASVELLRSGKTTVTILVEWSYRHFVNSRGLIMNLKCVFWQYTQWLLLKWYTLGVRKLFIMGDILGNIITYGHYNSKTNARLYWWIKWSLVRVFTPGRYVTKHFIRDQNWSPRCWMQCRVIYDTTHGNYLFDILKSSFKWSIILRTLVYFVLI